MGKMKMVAAALLLSAGTGKAQITNASFSERYGSTLNVAAGAPYFTNWNTAPYFTANYEFLVNTSFTLAPFVGITSFRTSYFEGANLQDYRTRVIPMGIKATYYFDNLLHLGPNWDIYMAASAGYLYSAVTWSASYSTSITPKDLSELGALYLDLHIGAEYHLSRRTGLIVDVSRGLATAGLALHKVPHMKHRR